MKMKIVAVGIILLFLFSIASSVSFAEDRSYRIPHASVNLFIQDDGLIHVEETISYLFDGQFNGVFRDIPLKKGQDIKNINVSVEGAYCKWELIEKGSEKQIKVYLYSNKELTDKISTDANIKVKYSYDITDAVNIYNDIGEIHYKLWGEEWEVNVESLDASVTFPSSKVSQYWFNPPEHLTYQKWNGSTINIKADSISSGNYFEFRALIPLSQFKNPIYANRINEAGKDKIIQIQENIAQDRENEKTFYTILPIIVILTSIIPIGAYLAFGREPKIEYSGIYEREPPTNDSPLFVNSMYGKGLSGTVGKPNMDGFQATIMMLINKKVFSLSTENSANGNKDLILRENKDVSSKIGLSSHESRAVFILNIFKDAYDNIVLNRISDHLSNRENARKFAGMYDNWIKSFEEEYYAPFKNKYFISTGNTIMKIYGVVAIFAGVILFLFGIPYVPESIGFWFISVILLIIIGIISIVTPSKVGGRWTEFGRTNDAKWENFKKYLKDFSLIKEYPPESIAIWNKYLVYATALGIADQVRKNMDMIVPSVGEYRSDVYLYNSYGGYAMMTHSFNRGISNAHSSDNDNSGFGGSGGGSGGGGGGAF